MTTYYSTQRTNERAVPPVLNNTKTKGYLVYQFFDFTVPAAGLEAGDVINVARIPVRATPVEGAWSFAGVDTGATVSVGNASSATAYAAASSANALDGTFFNSTAKGKFVETTAAVDVLLTLGAAGLTAGDNLKGYIAFFESYGG